MNARLFSILFLFTFLFAVFAAPVPDPVHELQSEESELDARGLEARANRGRATWYYPGLGACGKTNKNNDKVVALDPSRYKGKCGKYITVKYKGKSVRCKVVDLCPGCPKNAIDMSPSAFKQLGSLGTGVLNVQWTFS